MRNLSLLSLAFLSSSAWVVAAQIPYHVPKPSTNTPVDLNNTADLIIYVILPSILIVSGITYKIYKKISKS